MVELLVVITILLVLVGITVTVLNVSLDGEKIRVGTRQIQSYLMGARDRALYNGRPCGVRFLLDPIDNRTIRRMVFVQVPDDWQRGSFRVLGHPNPSMSILEEVLQDVDGDGYGETATTDWRQILRNASGQIIRPERIEIQGQWYTVIDESLPYTPTSGNLPRDRLLIRPAFRGPVGTLIGEGEYRLRRQAVLMPDAEPGVLPLSVVVDLNNCRRNPSTDAAGATLPASWKTGSPYSTVMDLMFSPRGAVIGPEASHGVIHLLINGSGDTELALSPLDPVNSTEKRVVTVFTRTGYVTTSKLFVGNNLFYYAERGETDE